jgi:hypothetical protein
MRFKLKARLRRSDTRTIRQALDQLGAKGSVRKEATSSSLKQRSKQPPAKERNRALLSAPRKVEKTTTRRAEWSSGDTAERYFDYVLKKTTKG